MKNNASAVRAEPSPLASRTAPFLIATAGGLLAIALGGAFGVDPLEQARLAARWTARSSFFVFLTVYSAPSLARLFPSPLTRAIVRSRRQWGLAFALAHTIHLGALTHYMLLSGEVRPLGVWILTVTAYVLIYALALTSNDTSQRLLGKWWKRLHRVGIHFIWLTFLASYASRIPDPARMHIGLVFTPVVLGALGLRFVARRYRSPTLKRAQAV